MQRILSTSPAKAGNNVFLSSKCYTKPEFCQVNTGEFVQVMLVF